MSVDLLFILGAGASHEFGYPLGSGLKREILDRIKPRTELRGNFLSADRTVEEIEDFIRKLYCADHSTIDEFLGSQKRDSNLRAIGKEAITLTIAEFERDQALFNTNTWHWYRRLLNHLRQYPQLAHRRSFCFFTFNYDRSLEYYLYEAMHSGGEFANTLREDFFEENFFHFHGNVGLLPWQKSDPQFTTRAYGAKVSGSNLSLSGKNILIPDEGLQIEKTFLERVEAARVVVFLGFGFHPQNLAKLKFDKWVSNPARKIYASTHGLEEEKRKTLRQSNNVELFDLDCANMIAELIRRLERGAV